MNAELSAVDQQIDLHAEAEDLDEKAVEELRERKATILGSLDTFGRRLAGLKDRKAQAERDEAQGRLDEIMAEAVGLTEQGVNLLTKYRECIRGAEEAIQTIIAIQREMFTLTHEAQYWQALHNLPAHILPKLELPQYEDLQTLNWTVPSVPRKPAEQSDEWSRKLGRLKSRKEQPRQEPIPVQSRRSEPRPEPISVTIPVRPHEDEPQPNRMSALLRG